MGMNIDIHVHNIDKAVEDIRALTDKEVDRQFVIGVFAKFGIIKGDEAYVLWNEYYSESGYNSGIEVMHFFERYYGIEDLWLDYDLGNGNMNAEEVAESLAIELPPPVDDDD